MKTNSKKGTTLFSIILLIPVMLYVAIKCNQAGKADRDSILTAYFEKWTKPMPLYGYNGLNTHGPSWDNEAFRDSAASLDFRAIRYPGGTVGDYWDWRKGWFIKETDVADDQNKPHVLHDLATYSKLPYSPTGLEQLKLIVDQTKCEVIFTLNMVTKDLNDQVEMLKHAQEIGIPVKWIELGNEYYIPNTAPRFKYSSVDDYGRNCYQWSRVLKQYFPGAQIAVIGGNRDLAQDERDWNNTVLADAKNIDAIVAHTYPKAFEVVDDNGIDFEKLYDATSGLLISQGYRSLPSNLNLWVTEYNIQWAATKGNTALSNYSLSWGQALSTILMTSIETELPNVTPQMVLDHSLGNWWAFAAVETATKTFRKLPNGMGFTIWCKASNNKTTLRKINFMDDRHNNLKEYEVSGWQFSGNDGPAKELITNYTDKPVTINVKAVTNGSPANYSTAFADKNKMIKSEQDVNHQGGPLVDNTLTLPAYSITVIRNQ